MAGDESHGGKVTQSIYEGRVDDRILRETGVVLVTPEQVQTATSGEE